MKTLRSPILWQVVSVLLAVVLIGYPFGAVWITDAAADPPHEDTRISDYQARFVVDDNGDMHVTEQVTVDFPDEYSHGIFRFFDRHDPNAPQLRRDPGAFTVEVDPGLSLDERLDQIAAIHPNVQNAIDEARANDDRAAMEEIDDLWYPLYDSVSTDHDPWNRYTDYQIGDPSEYLTSGKHVFVMEYDMTDVLLPNDQTGQFYWNLIPSGWNQPIDRAELSVTLPGNASGLRCAVGTGETGGCDSATGDGTTTIEVTATDLAPRTPVTVQTDVDVDPPVIWDALPWSVAWEPVLGTDEDDLYQLLGVAAIALVAGLALSLRSRDRYSPHTMVGAPPVDIGPAQSAYLITKRVSRAMPTATILHAAALGKLEIERREDKKGRPAVTLRPVDGVRYRDMDDITRRVALWVKDRPRPLDGTAGDGRKSGKWLSQLNGKIVEWAEKEGYLVKDRWWTARLIAVLLATVASVVLAFASEVGTVLALPTAAFAVAAVYSVRPSAKLRRTAAGRELTERVAGIQPLIADPSQDEVARNRFGDYLPWAVALACTGQWAQTSRTLSIDTTPHWLHTQTGSGIDSAIVDTTDACQSAVSASISAYTASIASSSGGSSSGGGFSGGGGGGGFSGGGGGGGGGGGSW